MSLKGRTNVVLCVKAIKPKHATMTVVRCDMYKVCSSLTFVDKQDEKKKKKNGMKPV